jgi:hypothetical protein
MTRVNINNAAGYAHNLSWRGAQSIWSEAALPTARLAHNGTRPLIVTGIWVYAAGRYEDTDARVWVGDDYGNSYTPLIRLGHEYGVTAARGFGVSKFFGNAVGQRMRVGVDAYGALVTFGRHFAGGWNVWADGEVQWSDSFIAGFFDFIQAPTAPQNVQAVQLGPGVARVNWTAEQDNGGSPITSYLVQRTTALPWGEAPIQQLSVPPSARSQQFSGLPTGLQYFRVFATNAVTAAAGSPSQQSNTAQVMVTAGQPGNTDAWTRYGAMPAGIVENTTTGLRRAILPGLHRLEDGKNVPYQAVSAIVKENYVSSGTRTIQAFAHGAQRVVGGLTPGRLYRLTAKGAWVGSVGGVETPNQYRLGVRDLDTWGPAIGFSVSKRVYSMGVVEFVAEAEQHAIAFRLEETVTRTGPVEMEAFAIFEIQLLELPTSISPFRLQSVAFESSLLNHFDLACNSVGGRWWVDTQGVTQFAAQLPAGPLIATFSDDPDDVAAGAMSYTDIRMSYDTRAIVNDLSVTNRGAVQDEDGWTTADETRNYKAPTSIATYGPRAADVDMSLYDQGAFAGSVNLRANQLLDDSLVLGSIPVQIRWNAQESPAIAAQLEIYGCVDIVFRGTTYHCRVINLKHELSPQRWMITIELIRK